MKRSRFSEEQIIGILKGHEAGVSVADLCRKYGAVTPAPPNLAKPTVSAKSGLEKTSGQGSRALHVRCIPEGHLSPPHREAAINPIEMDSGVPKLPASISA